jgi:PadR family transcriptional regulator, regulatory protein PadR
VWAGSRRDSGGPKRGLVLSKPKSDVLQGTLALLVLKTLARGPIHGYGITLHIQRVSSDVLRVEEGSLYPALHRMEQVGWISAEWRTSENNRRARYYRLTTAGRKQLAEEERNWARLTHAVAAVLECA